MQAIDPIDAREAEIVKIAESSEERAALERHLTEIIEGSVFKGSHRCCQFLKYIVDQAIAGHFDSLKERVIGVELFDRSTSYDTSDDAIVRVTASDVRKRLLQHYGKHGSTSEYRISLPSGSYIPEIVRLPRNELGQIGEGLAHKEMNALLQDSALVEDAAEAHEDQEHVHSKAIHLLHTARPANTEKKQWLRFGILIAAVNAAVWGVSWYHFSRSAVGPASDLLWSSIFSSPRPTHLITSDPNIVVIQEITGTELPLSDYANHKYLPEENQLTPEQVRIAHMILWGDNSSAALDPPISAGVAALAAKHSNKLDVRAARSIQLTDLKNDDNFIFLGSPRSDPWSALFRDELDFRFVFDNTTGQEIIQNVHPRPSELPSYVPTALGWATGQSFAIVAFVQNLDQHGQVLLVAGASGEGTEAAGKLVTDIPRLSVALQKCGIDPTGQIPYFELLMRVNTMAGAPNDSDVIACHILTAATAQKP